MIPPFIPHWISAENEWERRLAAINSPFIQNANRGETPLPQKVIPIHVSRR